MKYYIWFRLTGQIRKIEATSNEDALKIAEKQFGSKLEGNYVIGTSLFRKGDKIPYVGYGPIKDRI